MTRAASTERARRCRQRRRDGIAMVVPVEVDCVDIEMMIDLGELPEAQRCDRHAVGEAIGDLASRWLRAAVRRNGSGM